MNILQEVIKTLPQGVTPKVATTYTVTYPVSLPPEPPAHAHLSTDEGHSWTKETPDDKTWSCVKTGTRMLWGEILTGNQSVNVTFDVEDTSDKESEVVFTLSQYVEQRMPDSDTRDIRKVSGRLSSKVKEAYLALHGKPPGKRGMANAYPLSFMPTVDDIFERTV